MSERKELHVLGWTWTAATHIRNGKIDRKAECDAYFMEGLNRGHYQVVKSSMVGSTYYAAVKALKKCNPDGNGYMDIPPEEQSVFAVILLTSTDKKSAFDFGYKDMDETVGPYKYDCPRAILNLLSPTDNAYALEWRRVCQEHWRRRRIVARLPANAKIKVEMPFDTTYHKKGETVILAQAIPFGKRKPRWSSDRCYFSPWLMHRIVELGRYEILDGGKTNEN